MFDKISFRAMTFEIVVNRKIQHLGKCKALIIE